MTTTTPTSPASVADTHLAAWNETDAQRRAALLEQAWTRDANYVDPLMSGEGWAQIGALIGAVHERFAGFRFTRIGTPDGHGDHVRFSWSLGPAGAAEAPIAGTDLVELKEGRIHRVVGFLDRVPS